ncbi:MAG: PP2C family protein-serine/threonine phosphatase [Armatimonadota bacterium]
MARSLTKSASVAHATYHAVQQESDLVVAILRTALILIAVLAPLMSNATDLHRHAMQASVMLAAVYNVILFLFYWLRVRLRGQRAAVLFLDILLVSAWIYLTMSSGPGESGSPLFPFYYVLIIVSALWFGVSGSLISATLATVLYLFIVFGASGYDPLSLVDALYRQVIYLYLVAIVSGYLVDTFAREREQWTHTQVLLAQYQERFRAAQEVYEVLIPAHPPTVPGLELAARWRPALQEGGGDFYDVIPLESGKVVFAIADVSGKHTRGAIKLPLFKAAFLAAAQVWDDPGKVLAQVNKIVYPFLQPDMFISACVVTVDPRAHLLSYTSAGQDPPVFVQEQSRAPVLLETGGIVLGVEEHAVYPTESLTLAPGDTLCLYTDGITEARSVEAEEFGFQNLEARVQAGVALGLSADGIADNIFEAVAQHARGVARRDDMTLVVMRYRPETVTDVVA